MELCSVYMELDSVNMELCSIYMELDSINMELGSVNMELGRYNSSTAFPASALTTLQGQPVCACMH